MTRFDVALPELPLPANRTAAAPSSFTPLAFRGEQIDSPLAQRIQHAARREVRD